ncbi:MAG TPA: ATP-dependent metallopeptidase FtsH/Yme1/Tma family protein [Actinoallomurus sp.]|jgi:cell division protease FtsH|nr:ATP-dependent metallopeptidase FtsH/Yme1/Tma family protein [Actinoallomurus sp.]
MPKWWLWLLPMSIVVMLIAVPLMTTEGQDTRSLTYSDFVAKVSAGQVRAVTVDDHGGVRGTLSDGKSFTSRLPTVLNNSVITQQLQARGVKITARRSGSPAASQLAGVLPLVLIVAFFLWIGRRGPTSMMGGANAFGRSQAKIIEAERPTTRFADVAGYEGVKQEVGEVVDFLRAPDRYAAAGATGPKGVIMVGPPGTGKTLIARAVAGEAEVPFLSVTGSAFVEMFVGVGASRVRDLFEDARKRAPSIIFIDEIDAIGERRGAGSFGGSEEREQTLNQLLAEMDGFDESSGVVVLVAGGIRSVIARRAGIRPGAGPAIRAASRDRLRAGC